MMGGVEMRPGENWEFTKDTGCDNRHFTNILWFCYLRTPTYFNCIFANSLVVIKTVIHNLVYLQLLLIVVI